MHDRATTINWILAIGIGVLTFVVTRKVSNECPMLGNPVVALCVGGLTALSLGGSGTAGTLLIPYGALGLTLLFFFLLLPFLKGKESKEKKPPVITPPSSGKEDPWEKELRGRGELPRKWTSNTTTED